MSICTRCGKPNPDEISACQYCGAALVEQGYPNLKTSAQEQIPAWLESLKAVERPAPPASGQPSFSVADLVDPNALPSWMRPDSTARNVDSSQHPAARPAWMVAPNTDSGNAHIIPPGSLSVGSLIDSNSLPSWMRPDQTGNGPSNPISASSLVEPDRLPGWLTGQPSLPSQPSQPSHLPPPQPQQSFGQALETPILPYSSTPQQRSQSTWQAPPNNAQETRTPPDSGIAASSLVDMSTLPAWLRAENQDEQSRLSAGSLIDMNNLPAWLSAAEQEPQRSNNQPNAPGGQGTPPRIESIRVPSRPRAEMAPLEQSEMAANVFSSMLGVASVPSIYTSTPPGSPAPAAGGPVQQPFQTPGANQQGGMPGMQATSPAQNNWPGGMANTSQATMQQMGYSSNNVPGLPYAPQGQIGQPPDGIYTGQSAGIQSGQPQSSTAAGTKTAKRGFLETIRGWFHL